MFSVLDENSQWFQDLGQTQRVIGHLAPVVKPAPPMPRSRRHNIAHRRGRNRLVPYHHRRCPLAKPEV